MSDDSDFHPWLLHFFKLLQPFSLGGNAAKNWKLFRWRNYTLLSQLENWANKHQMGESIMLYQRCLALKLERDRLSFTLHPKDPQAIHTRATSSFPDQCPQERPRPDQCPLDVTIRSSSSSSVDGETPTPTDRLPPACLLNTSSASNINYFNGYQDGYLLFLAWQAANSVCVWDKELMLAVQECEYVGHLVGGVLLVGGQPHILATLTHAWSRALLAAPTGFTIIMLGEISDCSAVRVPQGQFTPLADALCWVIHRLTKDGGCAEADAVQALLTTTFPNLNAPDPAHVHTTLSNLIHHCKVYYSGHSYGIVQPHTYQVTAVPSTLPSSSFTLSGTASSTSHPLMNAGSGADIVCEDGVSHAAVQTDLAELINGASQPSDILITPKPSGSLCEGSPFAERHLSIQAVSTYGTANRTASLRLSPTRATLLASALASVPSSISSYTTNTYQAHDMSDITVRGERGSVLSKLLRVSPRRRVSCFSAQFPPPEWSNEAAPVFHLHSVAAQTSYHKKQEENEWWWCSRVEWTPRSATLPRRLPRPQYRKAPVLQKPDSFPVQVYTSSHIQEQPFPYVSPLQHKTRSSLHMSAIGSTDQLLTESSLTHYNVEPPIRSSSKRHPSSVHQSVDNHKLQSPVHSNSKNCKCPSQVRQHIENHKHRLSNNQNFEDKRSHKDNPVRTSPSRHGLDKPAIRNQLYEQLPHQMEPKSEANRTKGGAPVVRRQTLSQTSERELRGMICVKSSGKHMKKSGQIIVKNLREEQKTDECTYTLGQTQQEQALCHSTKGKNQKQQESCYRTRAVDTHQTSYKDCQDNIDILVNHSDKKLQKNNVKSNKHNNSFENKEEKNEIMLDTEEIEAKQVSDTLHRDKNLENNESYQLVVVKSDLKGIDDGSSRNYDRSCLQLDLGASHMNNCRIVMSSPQRLQDLKNNMLHDGSSLTDISKGSGHDVTSRNMCYQEVDKCHKELCSETLEQVQQQLSGSYLKQSRANSTSKHKGLSSSTEKTFSCSNNQYDNVIVIDKSPTQKKDESYQVMDTDKVSSSPNMEGTTLSTYPSLSELNLNFRSLAAQKIVCGASINSIDTLLEVNVAAERCNINNIHTQSVTNTEFGFL